MTKPAPLRLRVAHAYLPNALVRVLVLRAEDDSVLPAFGAGAHLQVQVRLANDVQDWRHYSLVDFAGTATAPQDYTIAVRLEAEGRGGSRFMHEGVQVGDTLEVLPPKNDFPLHDGPAPAVLLAGGIGITPLASMAAQRARLGQPVQLIYAGRARAHMAFLPELTDLLGDAMRVHADDECGAPLDVAGVLDACTEDAQLYICGPQALLDAVLAQAAARQWPRERLHFELFSTPQVEAGEGAFEVELAQSGLSFTVPAGQTILDCMLEHGCDPLFDCKRGECGVCTLDVLEGTPEHRDYFLSDSEKAEGKLIQICVSRAKSARLVLDA